MKKYIDMIVKHTEEGDLLPLAVWWSTGQLFEIDRVLDMQPCASLKAGGNGIRYLCRIKGQERYIWREEDRWFVEVS